MIEIISEIQVLLLLSVNTAADLKKHEILLSSLAVSAAASAVLDLVIGGRGPADILGGAALGLILLALSAATKGGVGAGDGLLVGVTGLCLGACENFGLLLWGLIFCALTAGAALLLCGADRKQEWPFVPFLLAADIWRLIFKCI